MFNKHVKPVLNVAKHFVVITLLLLVVIHVPIEQKCHVEIEHCLKIEINQKQIPVEYLQFDAFDTSFVGTLIIPNVRPAIHRQFYKKSIPAIIFSHIVFKQRIIPLQV